MLEKIWKFFFLRALHSVVQRQWFRRTWIIQEMALSARTPLVLCGNSMLCWDCFQNICTLFDLSFKACHWKDPYDIDSFFRRCHPQKLVETIRSELHTSGFQGRIDALTSMRDCIQDLYAGSQSGETGRGAAPLCIAMLYSNGANATDLKDRVYGILGLLPAAKRYSISVDYSKSLQEIYQDAFEFLISERDGFQVLSIAAGVSCGDDWLSWLPKYEKQSVESLVEPCFRRGSIYKSSGWLPPTYDVVDESILLLSGIPIDTVLQTADPIVDAKHETFLCDEDNSFIELAYNSVVALFLEAKDTEPCSTCTSSLTVATNLTCRHWLYAPKILCCTTGQRVDCMTYEHTNASDCNCGYHGMEEWDYIERASATPTKFHYTQRKSLREAISRAMVGDHLAYRNLDMSGVPAPADCEWLLPTVYNLTGWFRDLSTAAIDQTRTVSDYEDLKHLVKLSSRRICEGRKAFRTVNGWIGFGPAEMLPGDMIMVVAGADVPFLLRPSEVGNESLYRLVGECYVQGLMLGELFENMPNLEADGSRIALQTFHIY